LTSTIKILWNYGDTIYTIHTGVGEQVNLAAASPANLLPLGAWVGGRVVDGSPAARGIKCSFGMPSRIGRCHCARGLYWRIERHPPTPSLVTQIFTGFESDSIQDDASDSYDEPDY
jgi:hypothetical protein